MDNLVSMSVADRRVVFEQTEAKLGLPARSVEKDFWVCWILRELFGLPTWGERLTFKGGTALSKAWKLIERFSEDIDVVLDRDFLGFGGELSRKQLKKLVHECSARIQGELLPKLEHRLAALLPRSETWSLVPAALTEDSDQQTLLFHYPTVLAAGGAYVRQVVKIEMGARSDTEPIETPHIHPYIADAFPDRMRPDQFSLRTVAARRTFWEMAMLLHEETYRPAGKPRKARLARHYYDLWCLIRKGIAKEACADVGLFDRVAQHRQMFFRYGWLDYGLLRKGTLRLLPLAEQVPDWRQDYEAMGREMFMDEPPSFDDVLAVVKTFEAEFNQP